MDISTRPVGKPHGNYLGMWRFEKDFARFEDPDGIYTVTIYPNGRIEERVNGKITEECPHLEDATEELRNIGRYLWWPWIKCKVMGR